VAVKGANIVDEDKIEVLKESAINKFTLLAKEPEKDDIILVFKEDLVDVETNKKNWEIGIGKCMKFPNRISINGKTYRSDELDDVKEGATLINPRDIAKSDPRHKVTVLRATKAFLRAVDEATWAESFKTLDDIIRVVDEFSS
jgi:hypothetical protein